MPTLPALERTGIELSGRPLSEIAARSNPALQEAAARVAQAQTGVALAEQGLRPDVTLGFSYRIRKPVPMDPMSGTDMWSASASIDLPWVNRRDRVDQEVAAARAEGAAAEHDLEGLRNEVASRIEVLVIELIREDEQIALLETGLLPQAEGALASSRAAYGAGKAEFLTLLDNQANLYNLQLQRSELIAEHERNLAELEYLVGGSLTGEASPEEEGVDPGER